METRKTLMQSLGNYLQLKYQSNHREIVGELRNFHELADAEIDNLLRDAHEGLFCILIFHGGINEVFAKFVQEGALDVYCGDEILFLALTSEPIIGVETIRSATSNFKMETKTVTFEPFQIVRDLVGEKGSEVKFPGFLFFRSFVDDNDAVFVSASQISNVEDLALYSQSVALMANESYTSDSSSWPDKFSAALALNDYVYWRVGKASYFENVSKAIRYIWKRRQDLGVIIGAGV